MGFSFKDLEVSCSTCGEIWNIIHLRSGLIKDTNLPLREIEAWHGFANDLALAPRYREKFKEQGWVFGKWFTEVLQCPECPAWRVAQNE